MSNIGKLIFDSYLVSHGRVQICWWVKKVSKTIRKTNVFPTIKHLFVVISLWCLIAGLNDFPSQDNLYFSFNQFGRHLQFNKVSSSTFCKKGKFLTPHFMPTALARRRPDSKRSCHWHVVLKDFMMQNNAETDMVKSVTDMGHWMSCNLIDRYV